MSRYRNRDRSQRAGNTLGWPRDFGAAAFVNPAMTLAATGGAAFSLLQTGLVFDLNPTTGITYGNSAVVSAGTTPPVITISGGTFTSAATITITCTLIGIRGTWTGAWTSTSGGSGTFTSAATVAIVDSGITQISIAAGTAALNDTWTFQSAMSTWKDTGGGSYITIGHNTTLLNVNAADANFKSAPSISNTGLAGNWNAGSNLTGGAFPGGAISQPFALFLVLKANTTNEGTQGIYSDTSTHFGLASAGGPPSNWKPVVGGSAVDTGVAQDNAAHVICSVFNGASSKTFIDNSASPLATGGNAGASTMAGLRLWYNEAIAVQWGGGQIARVLAYSISPSTAQVGQNFGYLGATYGISAS